MQNVWITGRFAVGLCTASHCIGLYKETTLKWPKSPFALIYRDGVGGKRDAGRWSKSKTRIARRKRFLGPSLSSQLLPIFKVLFFSFRLFFSLDCGSRCCFCWSINTARNRRSAQMCVNVALHVLYVLLLNCFICEAANCCALFWCFIGSLNEPNYMHWMLWENWFIDVFFNIYLCRFLFYV